ncbi:MAG: TOBE domain-containing protein [Henriciella sp.]|nr:TOBE domain-containing protein [Henriciella sp.]
MAKDGWPVQAQFIERLGPETYVHGTLGDGQNLVMRVSGDFTIEPGSGVFAVADLGHAHLFGAGGQRLQNA